MMLNVSPRSSDKAAASVWLVNMYFGSTLAPTGQLAQDVAAKLLRNGYQVVAVFGNAQYNNHQSHSMRCPLVVLHRVCCGPFRPTGTVCQLIAWFFFYAGAAWFAFTHRLPDKILVMTTPPFLQLIFVLRKIISRKKVELILWNQDTYPEVLVAVGMIKARGWVHRSLEALQRFGIRRVDKTIVLDHAMQRRIEGYGAGDVRVIPNWECDRSESGKIEDPSLADLLTTVDANYKYLVLYSGNYGWGHDLSVVIDYVKQNTKNRDFFFLFVGGGSKWDDLRVLQHEYQIDCMAVLPYVSRPSFIALLQKAHFGLVALETACAGLMSPSKIHGYLAVGVPLIYVGPDGSNVDEAIETYHCGFRIDEYDCEAFVKCLDTICSSEFQYEEFSRRAINAANEQYVANVGTARIVEYLAFKEDKVVAHPGQTQKAAYSKISDAVPLESASERQTHVRDTTPM